MTGVSFDESSYFVIVSYNAPSSDHRVRVSGYYSGYFKDFEDGIYLDSYVDLTTGETRYAEFEDTRILLVQD